ncbi:MAG: YdcF family protein [Clostridium sp.]|uniref:YdcF family protein n=1 Tax=Clostridium sp. TaxID=1506 RepID=UPI0025BC6AD8|nr:YdcF family protein [Clostridium sp.]MCE5222330.1 YdcF family protein [Clostridium sp.]
MRKFWDIALGIVLILYIIAINIMSSARLAFSLPIVILGIILISYHFVKNKINEGKFLSKEFKFIKMFLCIGFICFLVIESVIISYPKHNENKDDYILVLGAGLSNKTTPSLILQGRLYAAIKCLEKNDTGYIVLSGGQGIDEDLPESHVMSKYLQDCGVDKERIIIEDESRNTNQNFKYSKEKIEEHSHKSLDEVNVKIITTDFHAFRSSILAKRNGYVNFDNYSSATVWYLIPVTYTREAFAIVKSLLFDK